MGHLSFGKWLLDHSEAVAYRFQGTFTAVTGTFVVPSPSSPDGSAAIWVGIDGDTCGNAILQTGVEFTYAGGSVTYGGESRLARYARIFLTSVCVD